MSIGKNFLSRVSEASKEKKYTFTHASNCPWNYGHDCECGKKTPTHSSDCGYIYGHDCDCGLDELKGKNQQFDLDEGIGEKLKAGIKKLFSKTPVYTMPEEGMRQFRELNAGKKLDDFTWRIGFMAGDLWPERTAKDAFKQAYYDELIAVDENTWYKAYAAGAKYSASKDKQSMKEGNTMSLGSTFLARLTEAKAPAKEKKGYQFDRGTEAMKRALRDIGGKMDFADKIAEVLNMCGIPGMYLNKPDVRESVIEAAMDLKSKPTRVAAFLAMHSALANYHGVTPLAEGKASYHGKANQDLSADEWKSMLRDIEELTAKELKNVEYVKDRILVNVENEGGTMSSTKAMSLAKKICESTNMFEAKEEDLEGAGFQQLVEEVLISLGIPEDMVTGAAKAGIKSGLKRTVAALKADSGVREAFRVYAQRAQIRLHDTIVGSMKGVKKPVAEGIGMSDTLAAKKIFDKIKGTPGLNKIFKVEALVKKYLDMVGKADTDVKSLTAAVWSLLEDAGLNEAQVYPGEGDTSQEHLAFIDEAKKLCLALGIPEVVLVRSQVLMSMKKVAMKNTANARAKTLMSKIQSVIKAVE